MSHTAITAAVVETGGAPFELASVELAGVQADEVRVRIAASGICHAWSSRCCGCAERRQVVLD